jgi:alkylation response protein AidB-like acyl-CoA dehydrogenase
MEFKIGTEQRELIAAVRQLAQSEFKQDAPKWMDGTFPWPNIKKLAGLGVLGMSVPEEYGGLGLSILDSALILEEIAKVDYVTAMAVLGEAGVQTRVISHYAPKAIKETLNKTGLVARLPEGGVDQQVRQREANLLQK